MASIFSHKNSDADLIEILELALKMADREDQRMTAHIIRMAILNEGCAFLEFPSVEGRAQCNDQ